MKDDKLYLLHLYECINRIQSYVSGGKQLFIEDLKTQDAVLRNLQVLAESSQRLSSALKEKHPSIDWKGLAGFRNVLVHDYLGINIEIVWPLIENHLPQLKQAISQLLAEQGIDAPKQLENK